MKKLSILAMGLLFVLTTACSVSGSGTLFDGKDSNKWKMTGDVSVQDDIMTLKGTDALAVLKNGKYKNFDLTLIYVLPREAKAPSGSIRTRP